MLKNKENLIILVLALIIVVLYFKKYYKKEDFEVMFSPYYPISNQVVVKDNNFENEIEDFRLEKIKKVLKEVIFNANEGNTNYMQFNYADRPVIKNMMTKDKLKPLTEFLMDAINRSWWLPCVLLFHGWLAHVFRYQRIYDFHLKPRL